MRIHLIGIGGVAMGNLAAMFKSQGHFVTGSDNKLYPPMSDKLKEWGIPVEVFSEKNIQDKDLCIVGNVISRGNVEVEALLNQNHTNYMSMPQALKEYFLKNKECIVIVGTHGKTTTSFLMTHLLKVANIEHGFFAGGVSQDGLDGFSVSEGKYFVIEGDEYDTSFFDKAPKFLHYKPRYVIIQALEFDHLDIYKDYDSYKRAFLNLFRLIPNKGLLIANQGNLGVSELLKEYMFSPVLSYRSQDLVRVGSPLKRKSPPIFFEIHGKKYDLSFILSLKNFTLMGRHNRMNALSVSLMGIYLGIDLKTIERALESFRGVMRRQQLRLDIPPKNLQLHLPRTKKVKGSGGVSFIEDFAHHPGALKAIIESVKEMYPKRKLHVLFEPRSASSHRNIFQREYQTYLSKADVIYLCEVFNRNKVPFSERLNVKEIVKCLNHKDSKVKSLSKNSKVKKDILSKLGSLKKNTKNERAYYGKEPEALFRVFQKKFKNSSQGDVILALSNGSFGGIYEKLEKFLKNMS